MFIIILNPSLISLVITRNAIMTAGNMYFSSVTNANINKSNAAIPIHRYGCNTAANTPVIMESIIKYFTLLNEIDINLKYYFPIILLIIE